MISRFGSFCFLLIMLFSGCQPSTSIPEMRMNQVQIIGSHNSYKIEIERPLMEQLISKDSNSIGLDYRHISLTEQLGLGIRSLELDVLYDPNGGQFLEPVGLKILDSLGLPVLQYDEKNELSEKGFKVFHIPDIDFRSHCLRFVGCLADIKEWSTMHSKHLPIIITINPKNSGIDEPGFTKVIPFNTAVLKALDKEILSVFEKEELITPTLVKGSAASLREAVLSNGWPTLASSRGQIMFVLDAGERVTSNYLETAQEERPMFVNVQEDHPEAGFFIINDPMKNRARIQGLIQQGFMVRTRADAYTTEARIGDKSRFVKAVSSGANVISTDYYLPELSPSGSFEVSFKNHSYEQCNAVLTTENCNL